MSLNPRQEAFAREYLVDLNMTAAYKRAGYSAKGHAAEVLASKLLKNAEVQKIVQEGRQEVAKKTLVTIEFVIDGLKEVAQRCMQRVPVVKRGKIVEGAWEFDSGGANRSLELLGKHLGLFPSKVELTGKGGESLFAPDQIVRMANEIKAVEGGG